jgi:tetratricopeptide (TPR) repeat protein
MAGRLDEAISLGREGLQIYPSEAPILVNTGAVLVRNGDHEAAEQYFLRALSTGSKGPPQAHKNLGDQAYRRGDEKAARTHYLHAAVLDPDLGDELYLRLATLSIQAEDQDGAIEYLQHAVRLNPESREAQARLKELTAGP